MPKPRRPPFAPGTIPPALQTISWEYMKPGEYHAEVVSDICEDIARGTSLRAACGKPGRPTVTTFFRWLDDERMPGIRAQYKRARDMQQDHYADELIEIADTEPDPARARVRMDARKWYTGKLRPDKYGDRLEHVGAGGKDLIPETSSDPQRVAHAVLLLLQSATPDPVIDMIEDAADD